MCKRLVYTPDRLADKCQATAPKLNLDVFREGRCPPHRDSHRDDPTADEQQRESWRGDSSRTVDDHRAVAVVGGFEPPGPCPVGGNRPERQHGVAWGNRDLPVPEPLSETVDRQPRQDHSDFVALRDVFPVEFFGYPFVGIQEQFDLLAVDVDAAGALTESELFSILLFVKFDPVATLHFRFVLLDRVPRYESASAVEGGFVGSIRPGPVGNDR